eukprot:gnl/TRDRNA2_/TRDRNA2_174896_c1_seq13.p1 gnl/TRDRNA2_/TRDRNA2_174896_c1~~gnl/TRDRNA2_/TRDRNA2_174896_c1_seq13.p1  ORF type:complete len:800 (+),score=164.95 gnl/TRDRNA2_/TRDRNA2_174896_c1_seq13:59-2401(+)
MAGSGAAEDLVPAGLSLVGIRAGMAQKLQRKLVDPSVRSAVLAGSSPPSAASGSCGIAGSTCDMPPPWPSPAVPGTAGRFVAKTPEQAHLAADVERRPSASSLSISRISPPRRRNSSPPMSIYPWTPGGVPPPSQRWPAPQSDEAKLANRRASGPMLFRSNSGPVPLRGGGIGRRCSTESAHVATHDKVVVAALTPSPLAAAPEALSNTPEHGDDDHELSSTPSTSVGAAGSQAEPPVDICDCFGRQQRDEGCVSMPHARRMSRSPTVRSIATPKIFSPPGHDRRGADYSFRCDSSATCSSGTSSSASASAEAPPSLKRHQQLKKQLQDTRERLAILEGEHRLLIDSGLAALLSATTAASHTPRSSFGARTGSAAELAKSAESCSPMPAMLPTGVPWSWTCMRQPMHGRSQAAAPELPADTVWVSMSSSAESVASSTAGDCGCLDEGSHAEQLDDTSKARSKLEQENRALRRAVECARLKNVELKALRDATVSRSEALEQHNSAAAKLLEEDSAHPVIDPAAFDDTEEAGDDTAAESGQSSPDFIWSSMARSKLPKAAEVSDANSELPTPQLRLIDRSSTAALAECRHISPQLQQEQSEQSSSCRADPHSQSDPAQQQSVPHSVHPKNDSGADSFAELMDEIRTAARTAADSLSRIKVQLQTNPCTSDLPQRSVVAAPAKELQEDHLLENFAEAARGAAGVLARLKEQMGGDAQPVPADKEADLASAACKVVTTKDQRPDPRTRALEEWRGSVEVSCTEHPAAGEPSLEQLPGSCCFARR